MPITRTRREDGAMTLVTPIKTAAELALGDAFVAARDHLPGAGVFADLRRAAFASFTETGLPHRRVEAWKYTDLRALMREAKPLAGLPSPADITAARGAMRAFADVAARRLVFVNGAFVPAASDLADLEPGLAIVPMAEALAGSHPMVRERLGKLTPKEANAALALNTAFMGDGAVIHVAPGAAVYRPIHLAFLHTGAANAAFTRSLVVAEEGAKVTIAKSFEGPDGVPYQVNTAIEVFAADEADVEIVRWQADGDQALHLSTMMVEAGTKTKLSTFSLNTGASICRHEVHVGFRGDHTLAAVRGANLLRGRQHADTTLVIDHDAPHGASRELFKSVIEGEGKGVFQGKIIVKPHAQKTDGRMSSNALLLSEHAEMSNKPELEIFADDVQCAHGATCGELDEELLFYLKARGIPTREAEALLIQSFVGEAVDEIADDALRETVGNAVETWLAARG
jgi:Fe-S cluster assembly protein SufD